MLSRDYRDIVTGMIISAIGILVVVYTASYYELGSVRRFGPGLFPMGLGVILAVFGLLIMIPAFLRKGEPVSFELRPFVAVLVSIGVFAAIVDHFGLVPAVIVLTLIAALGDSKLTPLGISVLAVTLSVAAVVIFRVGLGLPMRALVWPL